MDFVNHTPFPALAFEGIAQEDQRFHIVVLRQTLSFSTGELEYAETQQPLCESDSHFGEAGKSSVRQESDLCPFKPKCDIILNATAYRSNGIPGPDIGVLLRIKNPVSGKLILNKGLLVFGKRWFKKRRLLVRAALWCIKWGTLTLLRPSPWFRSRELPLVSLPLRYEFAYGGESRINAGDKAATRIPARHRLNSKELTQHPDSDVAPGSKPVAHSSFDFNPIGRGFARDWALKASRCKAVPAPQIERLEQSVSARDFWRWQKASRKKHTLSAREIAIQTPAGTGVRVKTHPARASLLGTVDEDFIKSDKPYPNDFDFAYFNAAPLDQQVDYLRGGETIELMNLCPPGTQGLVNDGRGGAFLRLTLPRHECFALVRMKSGEMYSVPLLVDTVIIEPTEHSLTLVWRLALPLEDDAPIRVLEARMRTHEEGDRIQSSVDELEQLSKNAAQPYPLTAPDEAIR
ncbi:DUF2169 domain-containing protein [Oxalobacteraceae bacterium]|nr:DUF2169 domain-containing protein [Oxalobacteraceae bacterium]